MTASSDSTAPRGQRPEKSAAAEKDVFDGPQAVELQVYAKPGSGSCLAYFRACSYPATRHYRPRRFFFHRKSAATWGLIPRLYQQARHTLLCFLLIESAHAVIRYEPTWRRQFLHLAMRRGRAIAKVAMARKLSVRLYWMWRKGWDYQQTSKFGSHVG